MTDSTGLKVILEELRRVAADERLDEVPSSVVIAGIIAVLSEQALLTKRIGRYERVLLAVAAVTGVLAIMHIPVPALQNFLKLVLIP